MMSSLLFKKVILSRVLFRMTSALTLISTFPSECRIHVFSLWLCTLFITFFFYNISKYFQYFSRDKVKIYEMINNHYRPTGFLRLSSSTHVNDTLQCLAIIIRSLISCRNNDMQPNGFLHSKKPVNIKFPIQRHNTFMSIVVVWLQLFLSHVRKIVISLNYLMIVMSWSRNSLATTSSSWASFTQS